MSKVIDTILSKDYIRTLSPMISSGLGLPSNQDPIFAFLKPKTKAYFEHFSSHKEDHSKLSHVDNIEDYTSYINLSTSEYNHFGDQNIYSFNEHCSNLFDIGFDSPRQQDDSKYSERSLLFPGVRHIENNMVIFEMPPSMRHVSYQHAYRDNANGDTYRQYYVPVPWQVYIAIFSDEMRLVDVQMYFSKTSLYSPDQQLYCPPMLNFYSNGALCRPFLSSIEDIEKYPKTISGIIASAFDWVWNTGFNWDITEQICEYLFSKKYQSMASLVDPNFYRKCEIYFQDVTPGNHAHPKVVDFLFELWQSIKLEDVLKIDWISFCVYGQFYYQSLGLYLNNDFPEYLENYISSNNIDIIPEDEIEDEESAQAREDDINSIIQSLSFRKVFSPHLYDYNSTLRHAYTIADKHLIQYKLKPPRIKTNNYETAAFSNHLQTKIIELNARQMRLES